MTKRSSNIGEYIFHPIHDDSPNHITGSHMTVFSRRICYGELAVGCSCAQSLRKLLGLSPEELIVKDLYQEQVSDTPL